MPDLIDLFQDLRDHPPANPSPLDEIRRRARIIRRRRAYRIVSVLPVLAAVVALSVVLTSTHTRNARLVTGPAGSPSATQGLAPLPVKMISGPPGWQPVDYLNARIWVPGNWAVLFPGTSPCGIALTDVVVLNPHFSEQCGPGPTPPGPQSYAFMQPNTPLPGHQAVHSINGHPVVGTTSPYSVMDLSVRLTLVGPQANAILATLGPSSRAAVLARGPMALAPSNWQTITYSGVSLRVPPGWPYKDPHSIAGCGGEFAQGPAVVLGPLLRLTCPPPNYEPPLGDGLRIAPASPNSALPETPYRTATGLRINVLNTGDSVLLDIDAPTADIAIGLGIDPSIARTIFYSLSATTGCLTSIKPVDPATVPPDVSAWARGQPVIGGGALWTILSAISVPGVQYNTGWHLKFPWYTTPNGLPQIQGRRLDGPGTFSFDVNHAYDSTGPFNTSTLNFSVPGCWEVTGRYETSVLQFHLRVGAG